MNRRKTGRRSSGVFYARGVNQSVMIVLVLLHVFPPVGMNRVVGVTNTGMCYAVGEPLTIGDKTLAQCSPPVGMNRLRVFLPRDSCCSPRPWDEPCCGLCVAVAMRVFPTPVGMNRFDRANPRSSVCSPRP